MSVPAFDSPPYGIIDKGQYSGIFVDTYRLIIEKLNWRVEFIECPSIERCLLLAEEGKLDMGAITSYRDYLYYLQPPIDTIHKTGVFYLQKGAPNIEEYDDLLGLTVGILIGSTFFKPFTSDSPIDIVEVPNRVQLLDMLALGRIDAFFGDEYLTDVLLKGKRFRALFKKADYRIKKKAMTHIAISKKSPFAKDRSKVEEVLRQLVELGKVREIYQKYGADNQ